MIAVMAASATREISQTVGGGSAQSGVGGVVEPAGVPPPRWGAWCLMSGTLLANFTVRYALPPLQLFMAREMRLGEAQRAALLGAFFSGYIATQFPAGLAVQRWGPKPLVTLNLIGHTAFLALLPVAARFGSGGIYLCLVGVGLSQGPLGPCHAANRVACVPSTGPLRAWSLTLTTIGSKLAGPLSGMAVPVCAARFGWRAVSSALAVMLAGTTATWHVFGPDPKPELADGAGARPKIEWRVFRTAGVLSTATAHLVDNFSTYSIGLLAPSVLTETLGLQPHELGPFLACPTALNPLMAILVTSAVTVLHKRGLSEVRIQKVATGVGGAVEAVFLLLLTAARTPRQFVSAWCGVIVGHCFHDHGFESNKSTSGGPDAAIIESVMNPIANIPGLVGPLLATFFLNRFGSRMPLFTLAAACQAGAALVFCKYAVHKPARDLLSMQSDNVQAEHED